jgi:hypothetical protein
MRSVLPRRLCLMRSWSRPGRCMVLGRSRTRRIVCLPRLLLGLRTRRWSRPLCRFRMRRVVHLRSWLWYRAVVYRCARVRCRCLVHTRSWSRRRLARRVISMRYVLRGTLLLVILRMRHVLRRACLLVVLRRTRYRARVVCIWGWRRTGRSRQIRPRCAWSVQGSRPCRGNHCGTPLIPRNELGGITPSCLLVLHLRRSRGDVALPLSGHLRRRRLSLDSARAPVVGHPRHIDIIDYRFVVHITHVSNVYVVDGAVVIEVATVPITSVVSRTGVTESVVDATVESDLRSPVAGVPNVKPSSKAPVARCPKEARLRGDHPRARYPVVPVVVRAPRPVSRSPDVTGARTQGLRINRQNRRAKPNRNDDLAPGGDGGRRDKQDQASKRTKTSHIGIPLSGSSTPPHRCQNQRPIASGKTT